MYGRVLSFLIRHFSNYYTLHRSDLAARAAPLDPHLKYFKTNKKKNLNYILINKFSFYKQYKIKYKIGQINIYNIKYFFINNLRERKVSYYFSR